MKWDELAFVNAQLAAMLKDGIPLEGALRQLCATMARGDLRNEFEKLQTDLANGVPLAEAFAARKFPAFYVQMIKVGVKSGDLPGVLTLVADYYESSNLIVTRLKGLMIYPVIVAAALFVASFGFSILIHHVQTEMFPIWGNLLEGAPLPALTEFSIQKAAFFLWLPTIVIGLFLLTFTWIAIHASSRRWLRWRIPAFRDVSLWQFASAMEVMLKGGCRLDEALEMMAQIEADSPALSQINQWRKHLADGQGKFDQIVKPNKMFPPLFVWLVANAGNELATGFKRAKEIYHDRASYRIESLLYVVLPISVLVLGGLIFCQVYSLIHYTLGEFMPMIQVI